MPWKWSLHHHLHCFVPSYHLGIGPTHPPSLHCHARFVKFSHRNNDCKLASTIMAEHKGEKMLLLLSASKESEMGILHRAAEQMRGEGFAQMREGTFSNTLLLLLPSTPAGCPCQNSHHAIILPAAAVVHEQPATSDNVWDIPPNCSAR